jgi:hypothetical protein
MFFFYGSFQERMPLYKYLQNRQRQNKLQNNKKANFKMDSIATAVTIPSFFSGIYITRPVIGSEQCQKRDKRKW